MVNQKTKLTIVTLVLLLSFLPLNAFAQTTIVGVVKDDVFEYSYAVTWNSTDKTLSTPEDVVELSSLQSFQIKIVNVTETIVNAEVTKQFTDGTTSTETGYVNIQSGELKLPFGYLIISSNLDKNDRIYPSGGLTAINQTLTRAYSSGNRETNQLVIEKTFVGHEEKTLFQFDKVKGIAVEYQYVSKDSYDSQIETFTETVINTNSDVWAVAEPTPSVPEFSLLVIPLILAATAVLLIGKNAKRLPLKL